MVWKKTNVTFYHKFKMTFKKRFYYQFWKVYFKFMWYIRKNIFFIVLLWYWVRVKIFIDILLVEVIIIIIVWIFNIFRIRSKILNIYLVICLENMTKNNKSIFFCFITIFNSFDYSSGVYWFKKKGSQKKSQHLVQSIFFFSYIVIPCVQKNTW